MAVLLFMGNGRKIAVNRWWLNSGGGASLQSIAIWIFHFGVDSPFIKDNTDSEAMWIQSF